jgi:low temperature requirement protein LtrA
VFWIPGGLAEGEKRLYFWIVALAIEYLSPPRCASGRRGWAFLRGQILGGRGRPYGERCAGFIIIALGEAVVVQGATFAELPGRRHCRPPSCRR